MRLKYFVTISFILAIITLHAQDVIVKGNIITNDNIPIPDVEVKSVNSIITTTSDKFGNFEITVPVNTVINISKDGFTSYELKVEEKTTQVLIRLKREHNVSVGYQELPSNNLTGAIVSVQSNDLNTGLIGSPEQLFQGKAAGVRVTIGSGEPGSDTFTYIRGVASLQGSDPLFIVDGFPLLNDGVYASSTDFGRGTSHPRDPLNFINPLDIESIDILKDESSTAIYGSRGGNGVVIIKTKSGAGAKHQLQFNSQFSLSGQQKYYDLLDRDQFLKGLADRGGDPVTSDFGDDIDWQREINRSSFSQKYDLAYSDMYTTGHYRVSFGYENQQGVIQESGLERIIGTASWNQSLLNSRLQLAANLSISKLDEEYSLITTNAGFQGDLLGSAYTANPTWENDPEVQVLSFSSNPLSLLKYHDDLATTNRSLLNLSLAYNLSKYVSVGAKVGMNKTSSEREAATSPDLLMSNGVYGNGRASIKNLERRSDILESTIKYDRIFKNSQLTAAAGYAFQSFNSESSDMEGWGFPNRSVTEMIIDLSRSVSTIQNNLTPGYLQYGYSDNTYFVAISNPSLSIIYPSNKPVIPVRSVKEELFSMNDELQSFFARVNYSIRSKIFIMGSLRADGSTLFGSNNKYGLFPAIAASWRLSEETFIPNFFSDLKLRVGFGKSGNQNIPHGANSATPQFSTTTININGDISPPVLTVSGIDNPDLKWEEMTGINLGLNFSFAENRINGSFDVYKKNTHDFLYFRPLAQPTPIAFALVNSKGKIINTGVDLALDFAAIKKSNLNLHLMMNIAYNKNAVKNFEGSLDMGNVFGQGLTGVTVQQIQNNEPLYSFYLPEFQGYDANGLNEYTSNGLKFINKNPIPNLIIAFGGTLRHKSWDATILFSGLLGYYMYNNTANALFTSGSLANARNVTTEVLSSLESPTNVPEASTRFLEKADFLRIQNITVGRNFQFTKRPFTMVRAFFCGQNLATWTHYSGLDPDTNTGSMGIDYSTYPKAKTFTIGLQATF